MEDIVGVGEASSSTGSSHSKLINYFGGMGFPEKMVQKAMRRMALGPQHQEPVDSDHSLSKYDETFVDDFSDSDSWSGNAENVGALLVDTGKTMLSLTDMGYKVEEVSMAMD